MLRGLAGSPRSIARLLLLVPVGIARIAFAQAGPGADWPQFGWDAASSGVSHARSGIDSRNLTSLIRRQVAIDGTVDSSAIYLQGVTVNGSAHDVFFVTTTYGSG